MLLLGLLVSYTHGAPCQAAQFHAKEQWKALTSPYYPDTIHAKTQCEWEIKAPKGKRVRISFDVLELLNHRTNGRCTTQAVDIIDGPRVRDQKNDAITLCGKKKPITDFITASNVARVRIVSDYYGENLNNKFKLRYQLTTEPANFKGHSNDKLKTDPGGFVVRQSAISNEKRIESGPEHAALSQWGEPPKAKTLSSGIRAQKNGRTAIRSGKSFRPAIKVKSALQNPQPTEYAHVPPPNPDDVQQGYIYKGPDHIPDPNLPLSQVLGHSAQPESNQATDELDPWGVRGPPPPADVLNNGYQPEVVVRPAGWLDLDTGDELENDYEEPEAEPTELEKWIAEMGLDINPWLLLVGAGGVVIFIVGILIAKSVKDYRDRQNLEKLQLDFLARGPQGITTSSGYSTAQKPILNQSPKVQTESGLRKTNITKPPAGYDSHEQSDDVYSDIDRNPQQRNLHTQVSKQLERYQRRERGDSGQNIGQNTADFRPSRR